MNYCDDYLCPNKDPWSGYCKSTVCTKQNQSTTICVPTAGNPKSQVVIWEQQPSSLMDDLYCPFCGYRIKFYKQGEHL